MSLEKQLRWGWCSCRSPSQPAAEVLGPLACAKRLHPEPLPASFLSFFYIVSHPFCSLFPSASVSVSLLHPPPFLPRLVCYPHFTEEGAEALRGKAACPKPHSGEAELSLGSLTPYSELFLMWLSSFLVSGHARVQERRGKGESRS